MMLQFRNIAGKRAAALFMLLPLGACAMQPRSPVTPAATGTAASTGFLVVGDTGYVSATPGKSGLMPVAQAMHQYCSTADCRFGLMVGDNIYENGAAGDAGDAELFRTRFTEPFGPLASLGRDFRIYVALGNHDWHSSRAGALAQADFLERNPPMHMNGLFYSVQPPGLGGQVEIFVVDTEMLLAPLSLPDMKSSADGVMVPTGKQKQGGGTNALPATEAEHGQLKWLERALAASKAKWKIVMGHHPLWQSRADSKYAQSIALRELMLPMLCRHADAYFAGHQHTMELQGDSCTGKAADGTARVLPNIVSGAGAKARPIDLPFQTWQQKRWPQLDQLWADGGSWGFSHVTLAGDRMVVRMLAVGKDGATTEAFRHEFINRPG
ncbi:metallophosphoesterase [Sphingomonas cavernae]|uniref:Calcineurin-like phosphoesterase domain-containing protein n=1 Tax=Sphingomonas cavernae TaxID=2320861 RepID=A0A418WQR5_9SPHN|nr:metallophosphoesterase [Sphingomonas cavernae]RJF93499.1 hypothetical protein D3876_04040 [Sphingomonas cavernae]